MLIIDKNFFEQITPFFFYKRVLFGDKIEDIIFTVDYGYDYFLNEFSYRCAEFNDSLQKLKIELIKGARSRSLQNQAYFARLVSTPGNSNGVVYTTAPSAVDQDAFGVNATATPLENRVRYSEPYLYSENIQIKLSWDTVPDQPGYVDLLLCGYNVPEKVLQMWN